MRQKIWAGRLAAAVLLLLSVLPGCGAAHGAGSSGVWDEETASYRSETMSGDCYLCGDNIERLFPSLCWGRKGVALIGLNSFAIRPVEIVRRVPADRREDMGPASFGAGGAGDGGFDVSMLVDHDRGFAAGTIDLYDDEVLDAEKAAAFLCADHLNAILPREAGGCFGVGAIDLETREVCVFGEKDRGALLGDCYVGWDPVGGPRGTERLSVTVFYCPVRYGEDDGT